MFGGLKANALRSNRRRLVPTAVYELQEIKIQWRISEQSNLNKYRKTPLPSLPFLLPIHRMVPLLRSKMFRSIDNDSVWRWNPIQSNPSMVQACDRLSSHALSMQSAPDFPHDFSSHTLRHHLGFALRFWMIVGFNIHSLFVESEFDCITLPEYFNAFK